MRSRTLGAVLILTAACCAGCRTANVSTQASDTWAVASRGKIAREEADQLRDAIAGVLGTHGFVAPIAVEAANSIVTMVSARTRPPADLVLAVVNVTPDREVVVELTAYAQVGSEWPSLGRLFRGPIDREENAIRSEIQARLKEGRNAPVRRDTQ